ncbi:DUF6575 domain-containing protein [Cohnella sp. GbtcB17]|uniref:DUF6575 domain-containing protein n=1 Tax=Cohnella sp. GbtcB17 TaxID=2824762 RepID=UPI001C310775|nr:DUF6575 domain-containing protein [Cohnella sp. GbtcB17]
MELFNTPLGEMKIIEHYLYYDRPFIFLCQDKLGSLFIVHLIDDDDTCEKWFLIPSSQLRVEMVRTGKMSLRQSVLLSETTWLWEITTPFDGSIGSAIRRNCDTLQENDLPEENAYLNFPDNRLPALNLDAEQQAQQSFRDVLLMYLNDGEHSQLINAEHLGAILLRSQGLLQTLVYKEGSSRGRIPKSIKDEATMYYAGDFAASVGIKLEAKYNGTIEPPIHGALKTLLNLLSAGASKERLISVLSGIQSRTITRYRFLLQALEQANVTFKAEWAAPSMEKVTAVLSLEDIRGAIELLEMEGEDLTQRITLNGELVGIITDKEKKRFNFEFLSYDGERYKGTLSDNLIEQIDAGLSWNVPAKNITIELDETIEINPATSEERVTYKAISIS